jgi:hypothetical protein
MSLINQEIVRKGLFIAPINRVYSNPAVDFSVTVSMSGFTFSNDFASLASGIVTINETGRYRVTADFVGRISLGSFAGVSSQFKLDVGSNVMASVGASGSVLTNTWQNQLKIKEDLTDTEGSIMALANNNFIGGFCKFHKSSEFFISSGEKIKFTASQNAFSGGTGFKVCMVGNLYIEQITE